MVAALDVVGSIVLELSGGSPVVVEGWALLDDERCAEEFLDDVRLRGFAVVRAFVHFTGYVSRQDRSFG